MAGVLKGVAVNDFLYFNSCHSLIKINFYRVYIRNPLDTSRLEVIVKRDFGSISISLLRYSRGTQVASVATKITLATLSSFCIGKMLSESFVQIFSLTYIVDNEFIFLG